MSSENTATDAAPIATSIPPVIVSDSSKKLQASGSTHRGLVRQQNEDSYQMQAKMGIFTVADGLGGHGRGEIASRMAVEIVGDFLASVTAQRNRPAASLAPNIPSANLLQLAFTKANKALRQTTPENIDKAHPMGCTLITALIEGNILHLAHVGDVRGYLLHNRQISCLTRDHTKVNALVDSGKINLVEADGHPERNIVNRAIGPTPNVAADITNQVLKNGDRILLCSDGLWNMLSNSTIEKLLKVPGETQVCCTNLIQKALESGGRDNISAIVIDYHT